MAARLIGHTDRTVRNWAAHGLISRELTFVDLPSLREVSKAQPVCGRPRKNREAPA